MKNSAIGSNWKDVRSQLFTKEEILESSSQFRKDTSSRPPRTGKELIRVDSYSMKTKEQTRKLAVGCSKHCFEVVDKTDEVSNHMSKARRR